VKTYSGLEYHTEKPKIYRRKYFTLSTYNENLFR